MSDTDQFEYNYAFERGYDSAQDALAAARDALSAAQARIRELHGLIDMYRDAVRIDVQMDGPKFMGTDASALKRAWDADRALNTTEKT